MGGDDSTGSSLSRALWIGDNLDVMRCLGAETVDLLYLDPPFNSRRTHRATAGSPAAGASFTDTWSTTRVRRERAWLAEHGAPAVQQTVCGAGLSAGQATQAYLTFMAARLVAAHRLLAPTGSLYLHCDTTVGHYLRQLLDGVFGHQQFRNEVVWAYGLGGSSQRSYSKKHDLLLFYSKTNGYRFNKPTVPATSNRLRGEAKGMLDVWTDIPSLNNMARERTGWPTQKPLSLMERIIAASSNPGDLVLDPFSGSGTTLVAAEKLRRRWVGIEQHSAAVDVTLRRLSDETNLDALHVHVGTAAPSA